MTDQPPKSAKSNRVVPILLLALGAVIVAYSMRTYRKSDMPKASFAWQEDLDKARLEAKDKGLPILLYFTADWCAPCKELARSVFPDPRLAETMRDWVPVRLDADAQRNAALASEYGISAIPTFIVLDPQGKYVTRQTGPMGVVTMMEWLSDARERAGAAGSAAK